MTHFDLLVIGGGTANNLASDAAEDGVETALVEKEALGGTCLTRGCDPSKALVHRADLLESIRGAERFGIDAEVTDVDFERIVAESTDPFREKAERMADEMRDADNLTLVEGEARFVDERTVRVDDERLSAEKVVVAAGARPVIPDGIDGLEEVDYLTSDEILTLDERPDRLVVVGGGYIAAEMAHVYGTLGAEISIVGRSETLLSEEDRDVSETVTEIYADRYDVNTGYEATAVTRDGDEITVRAEGDDGELEVTGDELLLAAGRRPNSDQLAAEAGGIDVDDDGFVEVDETFETSAANTWALGDIVGEHMFWHSALHEAEVVTRNVVHDREEEAAYPGMAHAVFSSPQVASTGMTEAELEEDDREYVTGRYEYANAPMGIAMKESDGFAKVLADPTDGEILGFHVVGRDASTLVHEVLVALASGSGTVSDITGTIHVHPALNEVVERAFEDV